MECITPTMDHLVQSLQKAYLELISAAATVLEAKDASEVQRTAQTDAALENFHNNLQLFHVACDHAQEFVESLRQRIGSECLVDEATGPITARIAKPGEEGSNRTAIPALSALRLEQMSKAVRWLVMELQHGATLGTPSSGGHSLPIEGRPEDDTNH